MKPLDAVPANRGGVRGVLILLENDNGDERKLFIEKHNVCTLIEFLSKNLQALLDMPGGDVIDDFYNNQREEK